MAIFRFPCLVYPQTPGSNPVRVDSAEDLASLDPNVRFITDNQFEVRDVDAEWFDDGESLSLSLIGDDQEDENLKALIETLENH